MTADWINPKGQKVAIANDSRIRVETGNSVYLFLSRLKTQYNGQYTCAANDSRAGFNLTVILFDPKCAEESGSEGDNFKMQCKAQGYSTPKYDWRVDNKTPEPPNYKIMGDGLMIHNVSQKDGKVNYMCRVLDMDSPVNAKVMNTTLKVKIKPRWVGNDKKAEHWGVLGEWVDLVCAVVAEPPPTFKWTNRNQSIFSRDPYFIMKDDNVSIPQVILRNEEMFGIYTCTVRNELGFLERNIYLYKGQKPAVPDLQAELVIHVAAKIRVIQPKSGAARKKDSTSTSDELEKGRLLPITGYFVQYKMIDCDGDWTTANVKTYDGGFILRGLTPQTSYHIRAASRNVASVGNFSKLLGIITTKNSPVVITKAANHPYSIFTVAINVAFAHIVIRL